MEYRTYPWSSVWCTVESAWHCEWEFYIRQWAVEEHLESTKRNVSRTSQTNFVFPLPTKNSSPRPTAPCEFSRWACHSYTDLITFSDRQIFTVTLMTRGKEAEENLRRRTERVKFPLTTMEIHHPCYGSLFSLRDKRYVLLSDYLLSELHILSSYLTNAQ